VRPTPSHALSEAERAELVRVANELCFAAVAPAPIAPMLAEEGVYLASESTSSRVLRDEGAGSSSRSRKDAPRRAPAHDAHRQHARRCGAGT
jgi:hypothetical protein